MCFSSIEQKNYRYVIRALVATARNQVTRKQPLSSRTRKRRQASLGKASHGECGSQGRARRRHPRPVHGHQDAGAVGRGRREEHRAFPAVWGGFVAIMFRPCVCESSRCCECNGAERCNSAAVWRCGRGRLVILCVCYCCSQCRRAAP